MTNRTNPARKTNESAPSAARDPHQKANLDKQGFLRFQPAFDLDAQAVIDAILTIEPELFRELVTTARIEPRYIAYAILQCGFDAKEFEALLDVGPAA